MSNIKFNYFNTLILEEFRREFLRDTLINKHLFNVGQ